MTTFGGFNVDLKRAKSKTKTKEVKQELSQEEKDLIEAIRLVLIDIRNELDEIVFKKHE